ncbi:GGDEF domain-containing protein [Thalassotalea profundi]|uniref:GGDEF domain-containing protein n=2 Tax=Thalassotalea profundi TaxID=2036687 RepID=A0ABQ3IW63_9GAMM|nr:GGDEF domain-containing protein [Thalassotalea profundi]
MLTRFSLKSQITWLSTSLIFLTVLFLTASYWFRVADYAEKQIERQMHFAQNVLNQNLSSQEQVLITAASVLAADFGFKQAVATRDNNTINSVLVNHGKRIKADLMMLLDLEGTLITTSALHQFERNVVETSIKKIPLRGVYAQVLSIDNKVFQVIVVPVKAPRTIAYVVIGFEFDENVLQELKELVALELTLLKNDAIIESSFDDKTIVNQLLLDVNQKTDNLLLTSSDYFHEMIDFGGSNEVSVVLSASLIEIHQDFNRLITSILIIAAIVIVIAIGFSRILSRGISTPLNILMNLTKKIGSGSLDVPKLTGRLPPEFKELYQGFSVMGSAIEHREEEIKYQAERDLLTGLYNRHTMLTKIDGYFVDNINVVLVAFNIKAFKVLNDTVGISNGDAILKEIAARLLVYVDKLDMNISQQVAVARLNADEFLLSIPISSPDEIEGFIQLLQLELERPYWLDGIKINLSLHFGIANSIMDGTNAERLMRRSTMAVAAADKEQLFVRYYQQGEDEAYLYKIRLIDEFKSALESENSPLFMNYQPKLNINTGKIDKLEALIRWINSEGQFVNPEMFVGLAEKAGLIVTLTRWVILHVIQQIAQWNQAGYRFQVSINLSAQDIQHEQFVDYLLTTVEKYEVEATQITLELTERDLAENEGLVATRLNHLKTLGFEISVDDYGIGQSSLAKLKSLPVDELKIDKCFILTLDQCAKDQDIVSSTILLGHKLGLRVVAEGVENKESLALLKEFNCDYAQGYYLSKPVTADKLIQWYDDYEPII